MRNTKKVDEYFDSLLTDSKVDVPGYSVVAYENGEIFYRREGGFRRVADAEREALPMTAKTRYRIASVSKMFTTLCVMQMVDQGKLDLDRDAGEYLGFPLRNPHYPDAVITVRMLMAHISSLRDKGGYVIPCRYSVEEMLVPGGKFYNNASHYAVPEEADNAAPGYCYTYCNLNFGLLGTIVERLSGERFDLYAKKHVLEPMGIKASFNVGLLDKESFDDLAVIYRRMTDGKRDIHGEWHAEMDDYHGIQHDADTIYISNPDLGGGVEPDDLKGYRIGTNATVFSPQGGLRISTEELSVFARMMMAGGVAPNGNRIISEERVKEIYRPVRIYDPAHDNHCAEDTGRSYGSGFNIISTEIGYDRISDVRDHTVIGHTGGACGLISACYFDPVGNYGIAYAFTGTGDDPGNYPGVFSRRSALQENTLKILFDELF